MKNLLIRFLPLSLMLQQKNDFQTKVKQIKNISKANNKDTAICEIFQSKRHKSVVNDVV